MRNQIRNLIDCLNQHTKAYDEGNPTLSDKEWDELFFQLQSLEEKSHIIFPDSPTQSISYKVMNQLEKVEHSHKMLSLEKTKDLNVVNSFAKGQDILAMCKLDGLTCSLRYENGKLVKAETRGNGLIGENILHNALVISSIPSQINHKGILVVDGEIICDYENFKKFEDEYKNPRNFASGSIRLLDSKDCSKRGLKFIAWDVIENSEADENSLFAKITTLSNYGFLIVPSVFLPSSSNFSLEETVATIQNLAKEELFPIDGVVFKYDNIEYGASLGETSHHFKNAIAYKFYDEIYETTLIDIEWSTGRSDVLTPVAIFEPVEIDGSVVERASLHNISIMDELSGGIAMVGDTLYIYKSNQIIPQVDSWVHGSKSREDILLLLPDVCPVCGAATSIKMDFMSKMLICTNPACGGRLINALDHFCGQTGLDIKGISKATLEKLIDWGWVESYTDIFELKRFKDDWIKKTGFGIKSVEKILEKIDASANCELYQFLAALGIPLIGTTAAKELAKYFTTWDNFINAVKSNFDFSTIPNFGLGMHNSIINFNYAEAELLVSHYISFKEPVSVSEQTNATTLSDITVVITGKLNHFKNRDELKEQIESLGGKVTGSVTKNTDYLINNDVASTSSKMVQAKRLNIPVVSEEEFVQLFLGQI